MVFAAVETGIWKCRKMPKNVGKLMISPSATIDVFLCLALFCSVLLCLALFCCVPSVLAKNAAIWCSPDSREKILPSAAGSDTLVIYHRVWLGRTPLCSSLLFSSLLFHYCAVVSVARKSESFKRFTTTLSQAFLSCSVFLLFSFYAGGGIASGGVVHFLVHFSPRLSANFHPSYQWTFIRLHFL